MATPSLPANRITPWKRVAVISFFGGLGFALAIALIFGSVVWYKSRPKPPEPWKTQAITAKYDYIKTVGEDNDIAFVYVLENNTDRDYRVESRDGIALAAKLEQEKSLSQLFSDEQKINFPIFVPAKQRVVFNVEMPYRYDKKLKSGAASEKRKEYRNELENYVKTHMDNLDGFVLFDSNNRYQINFPRGW